MNNVYHSLKTKGETYIGSVSTKYQEILIQIIDLEEFKNCETLRAQIGFVCSILRTNEITIPYRVIGQFFGKNKKTIRDHHQKFIEGVKNPGRPPIFSPNEIKQIYEKIIEGYENHDPMTFNDLLSFIGNEYAKYPEISTLRSLVHRMAGLKTIIGIPMEKERVMVTNDLFSKHLFDLSLIIDNIPSSLVFNIDESGFQEFVDHTECTVIVPIEYEQRTINIPISRKERRATLLGAISCDGSRLKPIIIISRKTYESELILNGYTEDQVLIKFQEKGFITSHLFEFWMKSVMIPEILKRKQDIGWPHHSVIILDNCSCHCSPSLIEQCMELGILFHFIPSHSSHLTQPLDVGFFGLQKQAQSRIHLAQDLNNQTKQLIKIIASYFAISLPHNIISAFRSCGISVYLSENRLFSYINPIFFRETRIEIDGLPTINHEQEKIFRINCDF